MVEPVEEASAAVAGPIVGACDEPVQSDMDMYNTMLLMTAYLSLWL
jgi:hypothetical protein